MHLYYTPVSSNSRKAVMTAKLLHLPVELVSVDLRKGEQRSPQFLKLNPNGKVPVLVDGDLVLWESQAIMIYFADKTPGNSLYPTDPVPRADVNRWLFWSASHLAPTVGILNYENMVKPLLGLGLPEGAQVDRAGKALRDLLQVLDGHLSTHEWLSAVGFSLADIAAACPLMSAIPAKLPVDGYSNVDRWLAKVHELDAWKQTEPTSWMAPRPS